MRVTVIGAGAVGTELARRLAHLPELSVVQVCDSKARHLQALNVHQNPKIRSFQVDARDPYVLKTILQGSALVISCVPSEFNFALTELCISMGIHFLDLGGNDRLLERQLSLNEAAQNAGVHVITNCGFAPGLTNVLCLQAIDQFEQVDAAQVRVGDLPIDPTPPFNFSAGWSVERIIEDYTNPVHLIEEGALTTYDPLTHLETLYFPEPFGKLEAFCTQGGMAALAGGVLGRVRNLDHKTIRWPGHNAQMRFLLALGFGDTQSIDVRTHLSYRDVLIRRMRQRLSTPVEDAMMLRLLVRGIRDGRKQTVVIEMLETFDADTGTAAIKKCTAAPVVALVSMFLKGAIQGGGAATPEHVVPHAQYLSAVEEAGLTFSTHWFEGYLDITDPSLVRLA